MLHRPPLLLLLLLLLSAAASAAAASHEDEAVAVLTGQDVLSGRVVRDTDAVWVVSYGAPWCTACTAFAPEFTRAAEKLRGAARFGTVDCDAAENKQFCVHSGMQAFPAVKIYPWQTQRNPYKPREALKTPVSYNGALDASALVAAVTAQLPREFVANVSSAAPDWRAQVAAQAAQPPLVLLFSAKADVSPLYRGLSLLYRGRLRFAQARAGDAELAAAFGVADAPALLVQLGSGELVRYDGPLKAAPLTAFLEQHAGPAAAQEQAKEAAEPSAASPVLALRNESHLASAVLQQEPVALLALLGGEAGACAAQWDAWRAAAAALAGQVITAEAEASADWAASYMSDPAACVTIVRLPFGADKADADVEVYGGALESKPLGGWALEAVPDFAQRITEASAQTYFQMEGHLPKMILVTDKDDTPLVWRALAANHRRHVQFAVVHSSDAMAKTLRAERVPCVKVMLVPPDSKPNADGARPLMLQDFPGPLKYEHLAGFAEALGAHIAAGASGSAQASSAATAADVAQLTDDDSMRDVCEARGGLCVLALLDGRGAALPAQLAQLRGVAARQGGGAPVHFAWLDAKRYPAAAAAFDAHTTPAAVVLSARKLRYAPLHGVFGADKLGSLVEDVLAGRVATVPLTELPRLVEVQPDAADAAPAQEAAAEEFDLSEILGVEVDATSREEQLRQAEAAVRAEAEEAKAAKAAAQAAAQAEAAARPKKKKKSKKRAGAKAEL